MHDNDEAMLRHQQWSELRTGDLILDGGGGEWLVTSRHPGPTPPGRPPGPRVPITTCLQGHGPRRATVRPPVVTVTRWPEHPVTRRVTAYQAARERDDAAMAAALMVLAPQFPGLSVIRL